MVQGDDASLVHTPKDIVMGTPISNLQAGTKGNDVRGRELDAAKRRDLINGTGVQVVDRDLASSHTGNVIVVERQRRCRCGDDLKLAPI